jgi:hypothetical protein
MLIYRIPLDMHLNKDTERKMQIHSVYSLNTCTHFLFSFWFKASISVATLCIYASYNNNNNKFFLKKKKKKKKGCIVPEKEKELSV